ncbi:uncharacterized protein LOC18013589 [Eutrema salsugineum]|uniref:uncharacterized protein LOC18013589 n=1 Tax=Eutrema salsugineum TaxID=72664 RepID=UPI000CED46AB|nr:uncharacterized protein LOC18013589 [Eutrema salsugineum]
MLWLKESDVFDSKYLSEIQVFLCISDLQLQCTLWGDYAKQVSDYVKRNSASVVLILIRLACIKEYRGEVSVSNAFSTTLILMDPVTTYATRFRSELPNNRYILTPVEEEASKDSDEVLIEDFFGDNIYRRTLDGVHNASRVGKYVTLVSVTSIGNSNSWYYIACKTCNKKVYPIPQKTSDIGPPLWKCVNCLKNVLEVTACFFLMLNVTDGDGGLAVFLLFDQHAQRLFKKTAEEVYEELDGAPISLSSSIEESESSPISPSTPV